MIDIHAQAYGYSDPSDLRNFQCAQNNAAPPATEFERALADLKALDHHLEAASGNIGHFIARAIGDEGTAAQNTTAPREAFTPGFVGDIRRAIQDLNDRAAVLRDMSSKLGRIG